MNKQRSLSEQIFQFFLIAGVSWLLLNRFFPQSPPAGALPPRPALPVAQAFKGIEPKQGPAETKIEALAEVKKLQADVLKNPQDPLAYWSRLRAALLHQYVLGDLEQKDRPGGIFGMGARVKYFPAYDEIISHAAGDAVDAQATYQSGDLLWRQSIQGGKRPSGEAASGLESLIHKGRGSSAFMDQQILVPAQIDPAKVPVSGIPNEGFVPVQVRNLRGTLANPNPQGIPDRVNAYYSDKVLYRVLDGLVNLWGAHPNYSYGMAFVSFAIILRCLLQPLTKRQYDSMKGMAAVAPEMKKIQERYKGKTEGDAQVKMMKEMRELNQRHGVNPSLGCGLALIQAPIFMFVVYPLIQNYVAKLELTGASFLWIHSLAHHDIPLLVLYGISQFLSSRLSMTAPTDDMQRQQAIIMSFIFPFLSPIFMFTFPSAFVLYWMSYNAINAVFQWRMLKAADPNKSIIRTLRGDDLKIRNPDADAVPSRPGSDIKLEKQEPKALESGDSGLSHGSSNGSSNGYSNGKAKSSPNGIVLTPLDGGSSQIPKKRKKR